MIFGNTKPPPLTAFCTKLSAPENLLKLADGMTAGRSNTDKRPVLLALVIMAAAGHFVRGFQWEGRCRPGCGWNLFSAISGTMKLSDQAATSTS
jgi:hypothetical protein